jgi:hypothetical protein
MSDKKLSNNLFESLVILSESLREKGFKAESMALDEKIRNYKTAEVHLYNAFEETGEDLVNRAHPDGEVEMAPSKGGHGVVETQNTEHAKVLKVVEKVPHGKLSEAQSLVSMAASVLGIEKAGQDDGAYFSQRKYLEGQRDAFYTSDEDKKSYDEQIAELDRKHAGSKMSGNLRDISKIPLDIAEQTAQKVEESKQKAEEALKTQEKIRQDAIDASIRAKALADHGVAKTDLESIVSPLQHASTSCAELIKALQDPNYYNAMIDANYNVSKMIQTAMNNKRTADSIISAIRKLPADAEGKVLVEDLQKVVPSATNYGLLLEQAMAFDRSVVADNNAIIGLLQSLNVKAQSSVELLNKTAQVPERQSLPGAPPAPATKPGQPTVTLTPQLFPGQNQPPKPGASKPKGPVVSPTESSAVKEMQVRLADYLAKILRDKSDAVKKMLPGIGDKIPGLIEKLTSIHGSKVTSTNPYDGLWGSRTDSALVAVNEDIIKEWNAKYTKYAVSVLKTNNKQGFMGQPAAKANAEENTKTLDSLIKFLSGGTVGASAKYSVELNVQGKPVTLTNLDAGSLNSLFKLLLRSGVVHAIKAPSVVVPESGSVPGAATGTTSGVGGISGGSTSKVQADINEFFNSVMKLGQVKPQGTGYNPPGQSVLKIEKGEPTPADLQRLGLTKSQWDAVLREINGQLISGAESTVGDDAKTEAYQALQRMIYNVYQELVQKTSDSKDPNAIVDVSAPPISGPRYSRDYIDKLRQQGYDEDQIIAMLRGGRGGRSGVGSEGQSYGLGDDGAPPADSPPITNVIDFRHPLWAKSGITPVYTVLPLNSVKNYSFDADRAIELASLWGRRLRSSNPLMDTYVYISKLKAAMDDISDEYTSNRPGTDRESNITETAKQRWFTVLNGIQKLLSQATVGSTTRR